MPDWLVVLVGGGAGALARYAVGRWASARFPHALLDFPWHTFGINVLGSFVLGLVAVVCKDRPTWFFLLGTGVCGGFTTFSTFSVELLTMLEQDRPTAAAGYVAGSVAAGLLGAWVGVRLARGM
jgi:CrcB protein